MRAWNRREPCCFEFVKVAPGFCPAKVHCGSQSFIRDGYHELRYFFQKSPGIARRCHGDDKNRMVVIRRPDLAPPERKEVLFARVVAYSTQYTASAGPHAIEDLRGVIPEIYLFRCLHSNALYLP